MRVRVKAKRVADVSELSHVAFGTYLEGRRSDGPLLVVEEGLAWDAADPHAIFMRLVESADLAQVRARFDERFEFVEVGDAPA